MDPSFLTQSVHAGREDLSELGVHAPPLDYSSTYPIHDLEQGMASIDAFVKGEARAKNPIYSRLFNPTVNRWEQAVAQLEGAEAGCVAFSSGMAAATAALMALRVLSVDDGKPRTHVVAVRPLYGGTDHLLANGLMGLEVTWAQADEIASAIREDTGLIWIETPANPTLQVVDIAAAAKAAGDIPVIVDNTFSTPILQRPIEHGASLVLHSATKFLGGHGDVLAGVVACKDEQWAMALRQIRIVTGGVLHPQAAWLLHRSLPTLPLRVQQAQRNAQALVAWLRSRDGIDQVFYPDNCEVAKRQMDGPGAILAFEVRGGHDAAAKVMKKVKLCTPAVSLGSTDTLIQHPAGLTHRIVEEHARKEFGITEGLLRVSAGIESSADIIADLEQALS
ncbi:MAG TPA: PLP-dependent transferase [Planctomycetota bacterium]|jgi:methionine-gamma-lyase|nr:cystathionine gamma-synthase [Planctomycetota bacterium]MDP6128917.1 PLP-dependent transferase [Planctomycetota bacterium]MDP7245086.1 PLP-dependent transferase [Planctomycetota bacterium]HJM40338.1 PLP-dependent transferase [Planctomycetota bacterium]|tara:strand:- start:12425 stop:13600 length:1176 start_codon:yes stop_codon:yes gene_type:complete